MGLLDFVGQRVNQVAQQYNNNTVDTTDKTQKQSYRLNPQCFLLQNYNEINSDITERRRIDAAYSIKNFSMTSGEVSEIINLMAPKNVQPFLSNLTPAQKSILQPYIRFFKVYKVGQTEKKSEEFIFKTYSTAQDKIDGVANIDRIKNSGLGRLPDFGLKSISFKESGGYEQAHVPATILAEIEFTCNTLDAILTNYKEVGPDGQIIYPFGRTEQLEPPPPLLDFISYSDKFAHDSVRKDFDCFDTIFNSLVDVNKIEIHAHLGWSIPANGGNLREFVTPQDFKNFKTAIENSRITLILNLIKSQYNFKKDGSIGIKAEYQARVESIMNDPALGVLNFDLVSEQALKALFQDQKQNTQTNSFQSDPRNSVFIKQDEFFRNAAISPLSTIRVLCEQIKRDPNSEQSKKNQKTIQELVQGLRVVARTAFATTDNRVRVLNQMKLIDQLVKENKIFHWEVGLVEFNTYKYAQQDAIKLLRQRNPNATDQQIKILAQTLYPDIFSSTKFDSKNIATSGIILEANRQRLTKELAEAAEEADSQKRKDKQAEVLKDFKEKSEKATDPNKHRISWFYLGDLFDIILREFYSKSESSDIRFILGPMQSPSSNKIFNLANLPISLDLFVQWWTQNVVIPGRTTYSLKNFIKDILSQIIAPATGQGCEGNDGSKVTLRGNYIIFHAPKGFSFENGVIHTKEKIKELANAIQAPTTRPEDLITYVYIYALDSKFNGRTGDKTQDESDGIYHLTHGQNRGIVRDIQFSRVETKGRRESLLEQSDSINNIAQHSERYNAKVFMEGNGIFKPGMQVFINPYTASITKAVSPVRLANVLGLGGYYWISNVETIFERSNYETIIECIWTSPGSHSVGVNEQPTIKPDLSKNPIKK